MVRQDCHRLKRRDWLAAIAAIVASPAHAQAPARLVWIAPGTPASEAARAAVLRGGLADNGLVEGRDYILETFYAEGDYQRLPELTRQAMARGPAVLLVVTIASVRLAQQATKTVPIVFIATNDPVGAGLIDSLARPGGNTTGVATMADDVAPKLIEIMHRALPRVRQAKALMNPGNATNRPIFERMKAAAATLGIEVQAVEVTTPDGVEDWLGPPSASPPDALIVVPDAMFVAVAGRIAQLALTRRVALIGPFREVAVAGGLLSYGPSLPALVRRSAFYVKRILAGARPAELPVEQPTVFELAINLRTAQALDVTIPPKVLALADEVFE